MDNSELKEIVTKVIEKIGMADEQAKAPAEPVEVTLDMTQEEALAANLANHPLEDTFQVEISARHVHLTEKDFKILFGEDAVITKKKDLGYPTGYLAEQRVNLVGPKGMFKSVAVLGPCRGYTQAEIAMTDSFTLGIKPPVRMSGDLHDAADVLIVGPKGMIDAKKSVIVAHAHVHLNEAEAANYNVKDGEAVKVEILSERPITIEKAIVRVNNLWYASMHIDTDEANAGGVTTSTRAIIHKIEKE